MNTVIIPKNLIKEKELVVVSKKEYKEFLDWQKKVKPAKTYKPTKAEQKALVKARKDFKEGKFIEWTKLKGELDDYHRRPSRKTA